MKTTSSYPDKTGRKNTSRAYPGNSDRYSDSNRSYRRNYDYDEPNFPEDNAYYNTYDRGNRHNYEKDYNAFDRSHYNSPGREGYDLYNREHNSYPDESYKGYNSRNYDGVNSYGHGLNEDKRYRYEGYDRSEGYKGRNSDDYRNSRTDDYYDPSDTYNRRDERGYTYRHDEDYEREERNPGPEGRYSWGREDRDRSKGYYGYYESYPSYGQSESYSDHERYSGKTGSYRSRTDQYGEKDFDDSRRANIWDRRFW